MIFDVFCEELKMDIKEKVRDLSIQLMVRAADRFMEMYQSDTGKFLYVYGEGPRKNGWSVKYQGATYLFALLYKEKHASNPYYGKKSTLETAIGAGNVLADVRMSGKIKKASIQIFPIISPVVLAAISGNNAPAERKSII